MNSLEIFIFFRIDPPGKSMFYPQVLAYPLEFSIDILNRGVMVLSGIAHLHIFALPFSLYTHTALIDQ